MREGIPFDGLDMMCRRGVGRGRDRISELGHGIPATWQRDQPVLSLGPRSTRTCAGGRGIQSFEGVVKIHFLKMLKTNNSTSRLE